MKEISIKGMLFSEDEVCTCGEESIARTRKTLLIIGIAFIAAGILIPVLYLILAMVGNIVDSEASEIVSGAEAIATITLFSVLFIPGGILIGVSFDKAKKDPYEEGIAFLNRHFSYPIGFDGKVADLLVGDKIIELSENSTIKLIISSSDRKFQIKKSRRFSRIFTSEDVLEYEIKIDNEVVVTTNTQNKNGVGKTIAGGVLFGGTGAIAGAVSANGKSVTRQSQKERHHYTFLLKVNDILNPNYVVDVPSLRVAEELVTTFVLICQDNSSLGEAIEHSNYEVVTTDDVD